MNELKTKMIKGFTLIELLIVIAIILILIGIALPNFMNARLRAKVLQTKADMKAVDEAIHLYANDYPGGFSGRKWGCNNYAWWWDCDYIGASGSLPYHGIHTAWVMIHLGNFNPGTRYMGQVLTSPTPYLETCPLDYFNTAMESNPPLPTFGFPASFYINLMLPEANDGYGRPWVEFWQEYMMNDYPHLKNNFFFYMTSAGPDLHWHNDPRYVATAQGEKLYSPTNGATSHGDIWRFSSGVSIP